MLYRFTVRDAERQPRAMCVHAEEAAVLVAFIGDGATIYEREGLQRIWIQSSDQAAMAGSVRIGDASESYDAVAEWFG